jgi:hypothetical protein
MINTQEHVAGSSPAPCWADIAEKLNAEIDLIQDQWRKEREDVLSELGFLAADIQSCEEGGDKYVLYHHDCMSGTSCDACRIFSRIGHIVQMLGLPNAKADPAAVVGGSASSALMGSTEAR